MLYLNDVPEGGGGCTRFFQHTPTRLADIDTEGRLVGKEDAVVTRVRPRRGMAIVFPQGMMIHDGEPLGGAASKFRTFKDA